MGRDVTAGGGAGKLRRCDDQFVRRRFLFDRRGIGLRESRNSKEAGGQSSDQFGHFDSF